MAILDITAPGNSRESALSDQVLEQARKLYLDRILVPLDGSVESERALPFAAMITRRLNGEISLFHCLQPMHPVQAGRPGQVPYPDAQHDRGSHLATSYLEEVKARLKPNGLQSRWNVATGSAAPLIAYRAATGRIGLTVMASHNKPRVVRGLQSNVTANLWRLTAGPLFLINRAHVNVNGAPPTTPETIFVPFNGSETARAALPIATTLAMALESRLVLLLSAPDTDERNAENTVENVLSQTLAAREVAEELTEAGCHTEIEHVSGGVIGVARRQLQERGSWVVAGSQMRSGLTRIIKGSEGDNFLRRCRGPLIVVPRPNVAKSREKRLRKYMASSDGIGSVY